MRFRQKNKKSQRGVAMMMAMMTMTVMGILIAQLVYETAVYHRVVFNNIDKLRSRYLAKSALRMAILQIHAANKAREKAKSLGGAVSEDTINMIWQTPIILPPPTPPDADGFEKSALTEFTKTLSLNGNISTNISGESQKLSLNDLVWAESAATSTGTGTSTSTATSATTPEQQKQNLDGRRKNYKELFSQMLENRKQTDEKFEQQYHNTKGDDLIQNLIAWMDPSTDNDSENRPKEEYYKHLTPPSAIKNAPIASLSEIYMVKGFDDEIAKSIFDNFTTVQTGGVNINTASGTLLRSFIPTLTDRDLEAIAKRKEEPGPFKDEGEFWTFLETLGSFKESKDELQKKGIKFTTSETAYRVTISAVSGHSSRSWLAYVGALPPQLAAAPANTNGANGTQAGGPGYSGGDQIALPNSDSKPTQATDKPTSDSKKVGSSDVPNILYLKTD